jgi:hypothetical protein
MGEEERQKKSARAIEQRSNLRTANTASQKICRRNDHSDFEVSLRPKIIPGGNTFESWIAYPVLS